MNDYSCDPDGLAELVHQLMCTSRDLRAVIGGHGVYDGKDLFDPSLVQADRATAIVQEVAALMGKQKELKGKIHAGSNRPLSSRTTPRDTPAARAIIAEALRTDTKVPLLVTAGGTLTDIASAYLMEPAIASKLTLLWIGGGSYPNGGAENNLNTDITAAQVIFNDSTMPIWQIPQSAYLQCLVGTSELEARVKPRGRIGRYVWDAFYAQMVRLPLNQGETLLLGDNPLVLLSCLNAWFSPTLPPSSSFTNEFAPLINDNGTYTARTDGRKIRVFSQIDTRTMLSDFYSKLVINFR